MARKGKGLRAGETISSQQLADFANSSKDFETYYKNVVEHAMEVRKDALKSGRWTYNEASFRQYVANQLKAIRKKGYFAINHIDMKKKPGRKPMSPQQLNLFNQAQIRLALEAGHSKEAIAEAQGLITQQSD